MRRFPRSVALVFAAMASFAVSLPVAGQQPPSKPVRISFWNVEWFPGHKPEASPAEEIAHLANVQPEVAKLAPDVIGFSEIRDWKAVADAVARVPGMKVDVVGGFVDRDGKVIRQQTALASRLPCLGAWFEQWKAGENGHAPRRGFTFAAYQAAPRKVLLVYSLHLKSNRRPEAGEPSNESVREESIRQLLAHLRAMQKAYAPMGESAAIVGGDLNTSLDDSRFVKERTLRDLLHAGFAWPLARLAPRDRYTLPPHGRYSGTTFDHIFHLGPIQAAEIRVGETGPECSDHRAISAVLEWK